MGKWGSNLKDPISGAGLCFSADSLKTIPPWCNTDAMITWIDDMAKFELMKVYYGSDSEDKKALLSDHYYRNRNKIVWLQMQRCKEAGDLEGLNKIYQLNYDLALGDNEIVLL